MSNSISIETIDESDAISDGGLPTVSHADHEVDASASTTLRFWLLVGLVLPFLGMAPLLYSQARRLIEQQSFWFFPASMALGSWLLFWTGSYRPASLIRGRVAITLLWLGLAAASAGIYWYSPLAMHVAFVVVLTAWSLGAFGGTSWTRVLALCSLFYVTVPLPGGRDLQVSSALQSTAAWCCNGILDAISVPNIVEGDRIQIAESSFKVPVACAGADSVSAFMAIGIAVVAIRRCAFLPGLISLLTIPFFSVFAYVLRLLGIAFGEVYFKADLTAGWAHVACAGVAFSITLLAFWLTHRSIVAILEPVDVEAEKAGLIQFYQRIAKWPGIESGRADKASRSIWKPSLVWFGGPFVVCLLLGAISFYSAVTISDGETLVAGVSEEKAASFPSDGAFPDTFGGLKKIGFRSVTQPGSTALGKYSRLWKFDDQGNQVFVSLDFPFRGWQPVYTFYQTSGWKVLEIKPVEVPANLDPSWTVEEFKMQNQYGLYGYVWFAFFDENGLLVDRKNSSESISRKNIFERLQNRAQPATPLSYQVQVYFESGKELNEAELARNRNLFFAFFEQIRQQSKDALMKAKVGQ